MPRRHLRKITSVSSSKNSSLPLSFSLSLRRWSDCVVLFSVVLTDPLTRHVKGERCLVEPDPKALRTYRIYVESADSDEKLLFGQLSYQLCSANNYLYNLIIGNKLYHVRSCDLKDRRLAIIDTVPAAAVSPFHPYPALCCPLTLFQVIDSFCESNQVYRVNIDNREIQLGYLAIVILLDLHECNRSG